MPIPLPNLDDRRWTDLVDEGRAAIPRYAPAWTDHNAHDPGITLVELVAWLTEMTVFGLNRVTERHKRKFLALVNSRPIDPQPARVMLGFTPAPTLPPVLVPTGTECEGTAVDATIVPFRTTRDVTVSPLHLAAIQVDAGDGTLVDRSRDLRDRLTIAPLGSGQAADGSPAGPACYLGFDALPAGVPVTLGFQFAGPGNGQSERLRIIDEAEAQDQACRPVTTRLECGPDENADESGDVPSELPLHHSARLVWEALTARGWIALTPVAGDAAPAVEQVFDDTRAFTLDGIVELTCPADLEQQAIGAVADALFYLRARLAAGALDAAPELIDLTVNAVMAEQTVPVELETIGTGTGRPDQTFTLIAAPVVAESVRVSTIVGATERVWLRRFDFDAAARTDAVFVLDPASGAVTLGSGERGRMPEANAQIIASYLSTKAGLGNLGPHTVTRLRQSASNDAWLATLTPALRASVIDPAQFAIANHLMAVGGADTEPLDHAIGRAVERLHAHDRLLETASQYRVDTLDRIDRAVVRALRAPTRAVNILDLERVALATPGTRIARARGWASMHPGYPCLDATGIVTLVIVPEAPPERPAPSDGLLDAVWRYLDRRRMICTRLEIVGPRYVEVTVSGALQLRTGVSAAKTVARVAAALRSFLDPLNGGPDGLGWPFGRAVYRTEILHVIDGVPGVDHVASLTLLADEGPAQCGDLVLCPTALVYSGAHQIEVV